MRTRRGGAESTFRSSRQLSAPSVTAEGAACFSGAKTGTALGAVGIIGFVSGFIVLPLLVLVASAAGSDVDPELVGAMWVGAALLLLVLVGVVVMVVRTGPWHRLARVIAS